MKEKMTYGQIYSDEFLTTFGEFKDVVKNTKLEKEYEVDVEKLAKICKINVLFEDLDVSGSCENYHDETSKMESGNNSTVENKIIRVNKNEPIYRQRFTIAHELGHILLGHEGKSFRKLDHKEYGDFLERMNEVTANSFAAELLMPEILVRLALENSMKDFGYDKSSKFTASDVNLLATVTSMKMNISKEAFLYRLDNLNILSY
ncbi:ImmA/IrrE family metallo-endopeptidase [uncultured Fenollaria sp.]|uniref:ImmA/IrrE family metallo-endopeptidase n=1 Tax=uncultured Fenollaria sp. TaxID=1686315 RepID=UPI0025EBB9D5|nr:ImmA/IrrE family metallo-endopeptidase [uncultured Fenollaria sp.]